MPDTVLEYRCLLISPGDVEEERRALTDVVGSWNALIGRGLGARVELVRWESHAIPDMREPAQPAINRQLVDSCELGIAVFWSRLGTPTVKYASGSVEEIYRLVQRGARVLVYFSTKPIPQGALNSNQFTKLQEVKTQFKDAGLLKTYDSTSDLREQVLLHLTAIITELLTKNVERDATRLRRERIEAWYAAVRRDSFNRRQFATSEAYATLKHFLPGALQQEIDRSRDPLLVVALRGGVDPLQARLQEEIAKLEREWGLI